MRIKVPPEQLGLELGFPGSRPSDLEVSTVPDSGKIEPRLLQEMARLESLGQQDLRIPILIQLAHDLGPLARRKARLSESEEARLQASRRDLLERLAEMGVGEDIHRLELANALEMHLTGPQIREIAPHPDVRSIIWNREERVTAVSADQS